MRILRVRSLYEAFAKGAKETAFRARLDCVFIFAVATPNSRMKLLAPPERQAHCTTAANRLAPAATAIGRAKRRLREWNCECRCGSTRRPWRAGTRQLACGASRRRPAGPVAALMAWPIGLRSRPALVTAEVEPLAARSVMELAGQQTILPECSQRIALQAELHDAADGGNGDGFYLAIRDAKTIRPVVVASARNRHSGILDQRRSGRGCDCEAVLQLAGLSSGRRNGLRRLVSIFRQRQSSVAEGRRRRVRSQVFDRLMSHLGFVLSEVPKSGPGAPSVGTTDPALKQLNGMKGKRPQILRFTTPKLNNVWGPVRSG